MRGRPKLPPDPRIPVRLKLHWGAIQMLKAESQVTWFDVHTVANEAIKQFILGRRRERAVKQGNKINLSTGDIVPK